MAKPRVRLTDENDPLNSTERVLAGFERVSKIASQQDSKSASQQVKKPTSQQVNFSSSQLTSDLEEDEAISINELVDNSTSQLPNKSTSQQDNKLVSQSNNEVSPEAEDKSPASGDLSRDGDKYPFRDKKLTSPQDSKTKSRVANQIASQLSSKSTSQQVSKLRKSTFQISEYVLNRLEQLHLKLQLEMGKKDAPYKEVIVEEAIVQLIEQINSNPTEILEVLTKRQKERGN